MTRGVPWWSPAAPSVLAKAPMKYGPFRCYGCFDNRWETRIVGGAMRVPFPCPDCNPRGAA